MRLFESHAERRIRERSEQEQAYTARAVLRARIESDTAKFKRYFRFIPSHLWEMIRYRHDYEDELTNTEVYEMRENDISRVVVELCISVLKIRQMKLALACSSENTREEFRLSHLQSIVAFEEMQSEALRFFPEFEYVLRIGLPAEYLSLNDASRELQACA